MLSPALGSLIAVLARYCTTNCIGSTFPTGFSSIHQYLNGRALPYLSEHCIPVSSADTRWHLRSPTVIYLPYRVSGSTLTAVGRSQLLARWPGTHSRILFGIQRAAKTVLGVYLKRTCSRVISASNKRIRGSERLCAMQIHALTHQGRSRRSGHGLTTFSATKIFLVFFAF